MLGLDSLIHGDDERAIYWYEKFPFLIGPDSGDVRPFIESARDPETGKAFLDQWIESKLTSASNLNERRGPYFWYLAFGHLDDYWRGLEALGGDPAPGWSDSDTLEQSGMVFRSSGFARHPKYLPSSKASSVIDLWEKRGPPDHCSKASGEWVCE